MINLIRAITFLVVFFTLVFTIFSHGDEKHDTIKESEDNSIIVSDTEQEILDSIYLIINDKMVSLNPVLKRACYDCHSNQTVFPWYYKLPIIKGIIDEDITEAKKHLDMSSGFPFKGHGKPADDLLAIRNVILNKDMPPLRYRMLHWDAKPTDVESDSIINWIDFGLKELANIDMFPNIHEDSAH
jgi:hypothetical protein